MAVVDLRYARALESVVSQQGRNREDVKRELEDFLSMYRDNAPLREVLGDPSIPQEQKVRVLDALASRSGFSGTVRNFLAVVTSHERLGELREIVESYLQIADKDAGIAEAEVISAHPLDEAGRRVLESGIASMTGGGQVRATYREDAQLLGGAVVKVGSTVYDGSVRGQLEKMRQQLISAVH